jgi:hypothetical protein
LFVLSIIAVYLLLFHLFAFFAFSSLSSYCTTFLWNFSCVTRKKNICVTYKKWSAYDHLNQQYAKCHWVEPCLKLSITWHQLELELCSQQLLPQLMLYFCHTATLKSVLLRNQR